MRELDLTKLQVEFRDGVTAEEPILGRKYTLTHSDQTADLYLTIGREFAFDKVGWIRDEVYMKWDRDEQGIYYLNGTIDLDGGGKEVEKRNQIFRRELPLALQGIRNGDDGFYQQYPDFDDAQIWIYFDSDNPEFRKYELWGTPQDYRIIR